MYKIKYNYSKISERNYKKNHAEIENFQTLDLEGFQNFVNYLIRRGSKGAAGGYGVRVRHWTRFIDICHFCGIKYDFVGKIEDVNVETKFLLDVRTSFLYPNKKVFLVSRYVKYCQISIS